MTDGQFRWRIADAMIPASSTGPHASHESLCLLNDTDEAATVHISALFEHSSVQRSAAIVVGPWQSLHLRTDDPSRVGGLLIPPDMPYGMVIESTVDVAVQYSRLDTTQAAYALMSVTPETQGR